MNNIQGNASADAEIEVRINKPQLLGIVCASAVMPIPSILQIVRGGISSDKTNFVFLGLFLFLPAC